MSRKIAIDNPNYDFYMNQVSLCGNNAVGCFKLKEILDIKTNVIVDSMIRIHKDTRNYKLEEVEIESWFDSISSLKNEIIPSLVEINKSYGELYIVYGYRMPKDVSGIDKGYIVSVPIIVSKEAYMFMDFKRKENLKPYASDMKSFMKRMNYHEFDIMNKHRKHAYTIVIDGDESDYLFINQ